MSVFSREPERMTGRAQWYLIITAGAYLFIARFAIFHPDQWVSPSYDAIRLVAPLPAWGMAMVAAATMCLLGALTKSEGWARLGVAMAALSSGAWAWGFFASWVIGTLAGPTGPVAWGLITSFHLLQSRNPLRLPLEPVLRRVMARQQEDLSEAP
ncbi:hypothetical protein GCM10027586_00680 [Kineococcus gypseus]